MRQTLLAAVLFGAVGSLVTMAAAQDRGCPGRGRRLELRVAELERELAAARAEAVQGRYELCLCRVELRQVWVDYALCLGITRPCPGCYEPPMCEAPGGQ